MSTPNYAPGSIMDREQKWLAEQDIDSLRATIYNSLPRVIAANDFERRCPFLALDALIALARARTGETA